MPSLDDELAALVDTHSWTGRRCYVAQVLERIDGTTTADLLRRLIDETDRQPADISRTLARHGIDLPSQSIARHRRRRTGVGQPCRCP